MQLNKHHGDQKTPTKPSAAEDLVDRVRKADIRVKKVRTFDSDIFHGATVAPETDEDAEKLLTQLNEDSRVSAIYPVVSNSCWDSVLLQLAAVMPEPR